MTTLAAYNGRLGGQGYVSGFTPSSDDAKLIKELFGENAKTLAWAAQMATYYASERAAILKPPTAAPAAKKTAAPTAASAKKEDDDDVDLFGEETEEEKEAAAAKKAKDAAAKVEKASAKKAVIAKSTILMDIKPFDDTTDLEALAKKLKAIEKDGLVWGAHKLVPVAYGLKKLQIMLVIEDDKVDSNWIDDTIESFEEDVQSHDIVAWNKV